MLTADWSLFYCRGPELSRTIMQIWAYILFSLLVSFIHSVNIYDYYVLDQAIRKPRVETFGHYFHLCEFPNKRRQLISAVLQYTSSICISVRETPSGNTDFRKESQHKAFQRGFISDAAEGVQGARVSAWAAWSCRPKGKVTRELWLEGHFSAHTNMCAKQPGGYFSSLNKILT